MNLRSARASSSKYPDAAKDSSDLSSTSPSEDESVYMAHPATIKTSQKAKLKGIQNKCLITNESETKAAIQACHIVRRKIEVLFLLCAQDHH
jgi:hypothetical protein